VGEGKPPHQGSSCPVGTSGGSSDYKGLGSSSTRRYSARVLATKYPLTLAVGLLILGVSLAQDNPVGDPPPSPWAEEAVGLLVEKGVFIGYPDGTFRWREPLTRQEAALALYRLLVAHGLDRLSPEEVDRLLKGVEALKKDLEAQAQSLEDLKKEKEALEARVRELEAKPEADPQTLEALRKEKDDLARRVQVLEEALKGLEAAEKALETRKLEENLKKAEEALKGAGGSPPGPGRTSLGRSQGSGGLEAGPGGVIRNPPDPFPQHPPGHQWKRVWLRIRPGWVCRYAQRASTFSQSSPSVSTRPLATAASTRGQTRSTGWSSGE
jgi:hypothetical protein